MDSSDIDLLINTPITQINQISSGYAPVLPKHAAVSVSQIRSHRSIGIVCGKKQLREDGYLRLAVQSYGLHDPAVI